MLTRKSLLILSSSLLLLSGCQFAEPMVYPFPFKSADIQFTMTGNIEGTSSMLIKGNNSVTKLQGTGKVDNLKEKVNLSTLSLGSKQYKIDYDSKTAKEEQNTVYNDLSKITDQQEKLNYMIKVAVSKSKTGSVPTSKGQKEIAGQKCDLYDVPQVGEVCLWYGLPIYSSISIPSKNISSTMTATSIKLDTDIPDKEFQIPDNIKKE